MEPLLCRLSPTCKIFGNSSCIKMFTCKGTVHTKNAVWERRIPCTFSRLQVIALPLWYACSIVLLMAPKRRSQTMCLLKPNCIAPQYNAVLCGGFLKEVHALLFLHSSAMCSPLNCMGCKIAVHRNIAQKYHTMRCVSTNSTRTTYGAVRCDFSSFKWNQPFNKTK